MATEYPASNISGVGLATFAHSVAALTNGAISVLPAFDNELKIPSGDMVQATQDMRVDGGDAFAGPLEVTDPIFGLASLPFVVQSIEAARVVNARARPLYEAALAARGLKLLYVTIWPSTGLWSTKRLADVKDLQTLSVRTYDRNSREVFQSAGARADYLPFNEVIAKVKAYELNAILTSGDGGAGRELWEEFRHFTAINYAVPISLTFVRTNNFEALPQPHRAAVLSAASYTESSQYALLDTRVSENYARMRANGVTITDFPPSDLQYALKRGAAAAIAAWKQKVTASAIAIVDDAMRS